jgi:hypothetical protein
VPQPRVINQATRVFIVGTVTYMAAHRRLN